MFIMTCIGFIIVGSTWLLLLVGGVCFDTIVGEDCGLSVGYVE